VTAKPNCLALAIHTGYSSSKGRIIRKILSQKSANVEFFKNLMCQSFQILILNISLYLTAYHYMFDEVPNEEILYLKLGEFLMEGIPSSLIVYINFLYTFTLAKFNKMDVLGTQAEKIVEGSRLSLICFDKTGTLTETEVQFHQFVELITGDHKIISNEELMNDELITMIMASCNAVRQLGNNLRGDEIDIAMFKQVGSSIR
jgi:P-type E1-E2 ATPase